MKDFGIYMIFVLAIMAVWIPFWGLLFLLWSLGPLMLLPAWGAIVLTGSLWNWARKTANKESS